MAVYKLSKSTDECLFISSNSGTIELPFTNIFYLIAEKERTIISGHRWLYTVDMNIDTLSKALPGKMFLRIHHGYVVGREHVSAFENNEVYAPLIKLPVGEGYEVKKEDFPMVM